MATSDSLLTQHSPRNHGNRAPYPIPYNNINPHFTPASELRSVSTQPRPPVHEWAVGIRGRVDRDLAEGLRASTDDITDLVEELCGVFILALQKNRVSDWSYVKDVLALLHPYAKYFKKNQQITHYVDRVYYHLQQHKDKLESLHIMDAIVQVFPEDAKRLLPSGGDGRNFRTPTPPLEPAQSLSFRENPMLLPDGKDPYKLEQPGEDAKLKPKGLCMGDLKNALPVVVMETSKREAVWSEGLGLTAAALCMDLPSKPKPPVEEDTSSRSRAPSEVAPSWTKEAVFLNEDQFTISEQDADEYKPLAPMTGKQAVELFGQGRHLGKATFVYLNKTPNRHYRPYDLTVVPKHKANPNEHWIVSCFGIMHKIAAKPTQSKALYDWHREAVLWAAITKIPFYKNYLVKKAFIRWRANHKFNEYAKIREQVDTRLLLGVPSFGAAMLQISKLLQELITVRILPLELDHCYTLAEFEHAAQEKRKYGENILGKFFSYCKLIMEKTCEDSFQTLKFCEAQAKKDKALFSKESLYVQRQKKEQREHNLKKAQEETRRLGNLVQLVDKMLQCHLLQVTRTNISRFVKDTMSEGISPNRDALFVVKLVFSPKSTLTLFPSKDQFSGTLLSILRDIPTLISEMAQPMEHIAKGWLGHDEQTHKLDEGRLSQANHSRTQSSLSEQTAPSPMSKQHPADAASTMPPESRFTMATRSMQPPESRVTMTTRSIAGWTSLGAGLCRENGVITEDIDQEDNEGDEDGVKVQELEDISEPVLPEKAKRSKTADNLGVATPDLCVKSDFNSDLTIQGRGLLGQVNPLESANLLQRLSRDEVVCEALTQYQHLMESSMKDIDKFCEEQAWLSEIHTFTRTWDPRAVSDWKRAQAYTIETKLGEIRTWMERVRNVDRGFTTKNGLFHVDCGAIQEDIVPALMSAFKDLLNFTAGEARKFSMAFINEVKAVVDGMKEKDTNMRTFAAYAQQYSTYKNKMPELQKEVEYIKSLFEVIRLSYRSLNVEEEKCEEKVWQSWEAFLLQLQDAAEFVNTQTPIQLGNLQDTFQKLKKDAEKISTAASSGPFLDPSENPTMLLTTIKQYFEQFYAVQSQMMECSKYKDKITGQPYDTSRLAEMVQKMKVRAELWKYVEVSSHAIKDWKNRLFKKMNVEKALDKVTEWQHAAGQLKQLLPQGDQVLTYWYRLLSDFKQDLPLLLKLSSDALKPRHWKALFVSLGQVYQPAKMHTVSELISFNLREHSLQINSICSGAAAEFALEQSLIRLRKLWEDKEFKLAKHIPNIKQQKKVHLAPEKLKKGNKKKTRDIIVEQSHTTDVPDMCILIGADELQYILEDNLVTLQSMLVSPHLADLRTEAEVWCATLRQIEDIVDVWMHCQNKWQYLADVFRDSEVREKFTNLAARYASVDLQYQDIMKAVATDPKILSILSKRKGQKGWRELQGDVLRDNLVQLIQQQEEILQTLESILNQTRTAFPRFFFLSNEEVIDILCMTRDKRRWLPAVRKVFSGIEDLIFDLPPNKDDIKTAFDINLNADKLQVVAVEGILGEQVTLMSPLTPQFSPINWFSGLERNMKTAVGSLLQACLETRLREGLKAPEKILEELTVLDRNTPEPISNSREQKKLKSAVKRSFRHWLLRFPVQCVIAVEAVLWERDLGAVLKQGNKEALTNLRDKHQVRLDQYTAILRDNCLSYLESESRERLQILLSGLLAQYIHQRDIMDALSSIQEPNDKAFDWLKTLRYHMDSAQVRCLVPNHLPKEGQDNTNRKGLHPSHTSKGKDPTSISSSTNYVFGPCTIQQMNASFSYEYEYLGPAIRLAATPLTDRCHLSLTMAMHSSECGTLIGPSQTGKMETVKEYAKTMGRQLFSFDCTEASNISVLKQQLCGIVQSGCWTMFTNIQHMVPGLMSVFGQQIQVLCHAYSTLQCMGNQYGTQRNAATFSGCNKTSRVRRHSATTLHSLPNCTKLAAVQAKLSTSDGSIPQMTQRRHSISREQDVSTESLSGTKQIPLFESGSNTGSTSHNALLGDHTEPALTPLMPFTYKPNYIGHIKFNGMLMKAHAHFGCFLTMNTQSGLKHEIPLTLRTLMRQVAMVIPDRHIILETVLHCQGFQDAKALVGKMLTFADLLQTKYPGKYGFGLRAMKSAIDIATHRLYARRQVYQLSGRDGRDSRGSSVMGSDISGIDDPMDYLTFGNEEDHKEESALVFSIQAVLIPHMESVDQIRAIRNLLRSVFPWGRGTRPGTAHENDPVLMDAIQTQFVADKLQAAPRHVAKVLELYESLQHNAGVILVGPAGSGKTVCYETLSRVLNNLHFSQPSQDRMSGPMKGPRIESSPSTPEPRPHSSAASKVRRTAEMISQVTMHWTDTVGKHAEEKVYPRVDVSVVFPGALSVKELMGCYNEDKATWHDGILTRLIRNANLSSKAAKQFVEEQTEKKNKILLNPPSIIDQWIVMDGDLSVGWSEGVGPWLGSGETDGVCLGHGEQLKLAESTSMIFETLELTKASPAIMSRCAVVHLSSDVVHWKFLVESWIGSAKSCWEVTNESLELLQYLISDTFGPTLVFIANQCSLALTSDLLNSNQIRLNTVDGIQEVSSFFRIMSALCDKHFMNEELMEPGEQDDPTMSSLTKRLSVPDVQRRRASSVGDGLLGLRPRPVTLMSSIFAFAYVWAFGGHLHNRCAHKFDQFARDLLGKATNDVHFPGDDLVYDYCVDPNLGVLVPWGDKNQDRVKTLSTNYTIIPEVERYSGMIDILVGSNHPVLITGPPGVGKTALMQNLVQPKHYFVKTNLSPGLTCQSFEEFIVSKLRPRSVAMTAGAGNKQPKGGTSHLFFIDDLHCGSTDSTTGVQPCVEVLRQLMSTGGIYDRQRLHHRALETPNFVAACVPPSTTGVGSGTSSNFLSPRVTRLFTVISFFVHSDEAMQLMHGTSLQGWLEEFPAYSLDHHKELARALLSATLHLHGTVVNQLASSPINPQYMFSQHDIHRIIGGLYLMSPRARARPRHGGGGGGGRRGAAGGGGRPQGAGGRRIGRPGVDRQAKAMLPPMMRAVVRLWCHEATRTYSDRIVNEQDLSWFSQTLLDTVEKHFCTGQDRHPGSPPILLREMSTDSSSTEFSGGSLISLSAFDDEPSKPSDGDDFESSLDAAEMNDRWNSALTGESDGRNSRTREGSKMTATTDTSAATQSTPRTEDEEQGDEVGDAETTQSYVSSAAADTDGSTIGEEKAESQPPDMKPSSLDSSSVSSATSSSIPNGIHQPSPPASPPPFKILQPTPPSLGSPRPTIPIREDTSSTRTQERKQPTQGRRRAVTFQLNHVNDIRGQDMYTGPLMSMDQVLEAGENPCDIIFAKSIASGQGDGRGYIECREEQMYEGLHKALSQYNMSTHHNMELVFFKEAIRHVARLSRVLAIHGGNALLISLANSTGRSSLTTLAAYTTRCKMFDATSYQDQHNDETIYRAWVRDYMKRASHVAGLAGKPAVLFVRGNMHTGCLQDICALMNQGTCPDLYTQEELDQISTQMLPGSKVTGQRSQRLEMALERFYKKVLFNLHVVMALDCTAGSMNEIHHKLQEYPTLLNGSCCIDIYRPWSHEALVHVAEQWLRVPTADVHTLLPYKIPWSSEDVDNEVTALSHAMAYMHQTAVFSIQKMYRQPFKLFSPLTYLEFIDLFKNLACKIGRDEKTTINKYEEALDKLNDAFDNINNYNKELLRMRPQHEQAVRTAEKRLSEVEECRAILGAARDDCREDEKEIANMQTPLDSMKEQAQAELDKVNPIYEAALYALRSLNSADLDEIRTYHAPPMAVIKVVNSICLMFREAYDWQSGKTLINRNNFFQDLEFYDKANMPEDIYHKLNVLFIQDPDFKPDIVMRSSKAASSLCMWVHAVYAYASLHRNMRPKLNDVEMAEAKLQEAQGHLGQKRVKAQDVKGVLEEKSRQYKESIRQVRKLEHAMKNIENKIAMATNLMTNMSSQHATWKFNLEHANDNLTTAPGDALLTAACVCYQGPMKEQIRNTIFVDWVQRCRSGNFSLLKTEESRAMMTSSSVSPALDQVINANESQYLASSRNTSALESRNTSHTGSRNTSAINTTNSGRQTARSTMSMDDSESLASEDLLLGTDNSNSSPSGSRLTSRLQVDSAPPALYPVAIRADFSLEGILSTPEEQATWKEQGMCRDNAATHNALFMRTCCIGRKRQWPLIIDPENQVIHWVKLLQEREVVSFHEDDEADIDDDSPEQEMDLGGDLGYGNKPVSRGTTIGTLSEHGRESSAGTDFHGTPRTFTSYGADTPFKESLNDVDFRDDLAGTKNPPKTPCQINFNIKRPENNLWVIPADDADVEIKLIQAVVLGICLVITHIERRNIGVQFNQVIARNTVYDQGGKRTILIGGMEYEYDLRFKLYLSSSVPLELTGAGLMYIPIQRASVIDLSISPQGLTDHLLRDVLAFEKPEFEGQWRSIEKDIRDQEISLQQADDEILAMILALPHGILEEATLLETLLQYQQATLSTEATLLESHQLAKQHKLKQSFYVPVAEHGTLLYSIIHEVSQLHSLYHIPLSNFVAWFHEIIWSHQKDTTNISSAKARAVELINSLTRRIHEQVSSSLFQPHSELFAFLLAVKKMRLGAEVSNQEWELFVHGLDGVTMATQHDNQDNYPDWMTDKMKHMCICLESSMTAFKGLRNSLVTHNTQWKEYMQCDPVLLAPVPGEDQLQLTVMQKALLWRLLKPSKLAQICSDLTVYQLGAHLAVPKDYSIHEVLHQCDNVTPVVFILPRHYETGQEELHKGFEGHPAMYPTQALLKYTKDHHLNTDVNIVNLGISKQVHKALSVIKECMQCGKWAVLDNCHLVGQWDKQLLHCIQELITSQHHTPILAPRKPPPPSAKIKIKDADETNETCDVAMMKSDTHTIHANFRLFLVTTADSNTLLPGLIVQHGMKVSCEATSNFKASLLTNFNMSMKNMEKTQQKVASGPKAINELVYSVAFLHTVLSQRRLYHHLGFSRDYAWSQADLISALRMIQTIYNRNTETPVMLKDIRYLLTHVVYGGCVDCEQDFAIIQALVDNCIVVWVDSKMMPPSMGIPSLLASISHGGQRPNTSHSHGGRRSRSDSRGRSDSSMSGRSSASQARRFQRMFDAMKTEVQACHLGLMRDAIVVMEERKSRFISACLHSLHTTQPNIKTVFPESITHKLQHIIATIDSMQSINPPPSDSLNHLHNYLANELACYCSLLTSIQSDVSLLLQGSLGLVAVTPEIESLLLAISEDCVPKSWLPHHIPSYLGVQDWLMDVKQRMEMLQRWCRGEEGNQNEYCFNLAVFWNPKLFVKSLLQEYARKEYIEVYKLSLQIKVLGTTGIPDSQPDTGGVFITGLHLCNADWDAQRATIQLQKTIDNNYSALPAMWLKPTVWSIATETVKSTQSSYTCPVYAMSGSKEPCDTDKVVLTINLPCTLDSSTWVQKQVFAVAKL